MVALLLVVATPAAFAAWPHNPGVNLPVCTATGAQSSTSIASDGAGGAIVAWQDLRSGISQIYAQHILLSGVVDPAWPANGRALTTSFDNRYLPVIVADGAGGAIVAWQDLRVGDYDIYAQHVLASGAVDPAWPVDGRALCTAANNQQNATIVADGTGGAIVTWYDFRGGVSADIYAQHVLASGAADPLWPANGRALCVAANNQQFPTITSDGAGGAVVTWQDLRGGASFDIYAQHVLASGAADPAWPADGRALCVAANAQSNPTIAPDGSGGAIVSWFDFRGGLNYDIYAQHVLAGGSTDPWWPADGRALCTAASHQQYPTIVSDGGGGAVVTWQDLRGGGTYDVYAQHVLPSGAVDPLWPVDGRALSLAAGNQSLPNLTGDGAGGAIVTWQDSRSGGAWDVYAQHVLASGAVDAAWPADGRALCIASNDQPSPTITSDGTGGAIVAWPDYRVGTNTDIYAQRVARFGYLGTPEAERAGVHDLPNDQGGKVKVSWFSSWLDTENDPNLAAYDVYRSAPGSVAELAIEAGAHRLARFGEPPPAGGRSFVFSPTSAGLLTWEYVGTVAPVHFLPAYGFIAPTTGDSTGAYNPPTAFMVVARNNSGSMYWLSRPDSGYSVDNLAPAPPSPFVAAYSAGATHLHWGANSENDLAGYRLYRGSSSGFVPGPGNLVSAQPDTGFDDSGPAGSWYKLSAVDSHGNESVFAILGPGSTTDAPGPGALALAFAPPAPNPVRGEGAAFRLALPTEARVTLTLFDQQGRRVREVFRGTLPAGERYERWDGRDEAGKPVASGIYFARLEALGRSLRVRFAVVK